MPIGMELQELRGRFEIKNFELTCSVKTIQAKAAERTPTNDRIELKSEALFGSNGRQFNVFLAWMPKRCPSGMVEIDTESLVGLVLKGSEGCAETSYVKLQAELVNTDPSKNVRKAFRCWRVIRNEKDWWGWAPDMTPPAGFVTLRDILDSSKGWLHAGTLRIEVKLALALDDQTHNKSSPLRDNSYEALSTDFRSAFLSGDHADVTIQVKGQSETFRAHSFVLMARSSVFAAMLSSPMREGIEKNITVESLDFAAVQTTVSFLYSGQVDPDVLKSDEAALGILAAAHQYNIPSLVDLVVHVLAARLNVDTISEWFYIADLIGSTKFRARCMEFIRVHISEVQNTEKFAEFIAKRPVLFTEILASLFPPAKRQRVEH